jgi:hypothetical protein
VGWDSLAKRLFQEIINVGWVTYSSWLLRVLQELRGMMNSSIMLKERKKWR